MDLAKTNFYKKDILNKRIKNYNVINDNKP